MQQPANTIIHIVDDDPSVRSGLVRLVESMGWAARSFDSALAFLQNYRPVDVGCIILDVQMPEMSGPQLQELLLTHDILLPVIFLTAHGDLPTGIRAMKHGAIDFLQKPVDEKNLFEAIEQAVARYAATRQSRQQSEQVMLRISRLSKREREVMEHMLRGLLNKQIADCMGISMTTVKKHRARVMEKMQASSVAELVHLCGLAGLGAT